MRGSSSGSPSSAPHVEGAAPTRPSRVRRISAKTHLTYTGIVRRYIAGSELARLRLTVVQPEHVEDHLAVLHDRGLSRTTVRHCRLVLSSAYTAAIRLRKAAINPVLGTDLPGEPEPERVRMLRLSKADSWRIADAVADRRDGLREFVEVIARTGMRPGEAAALRWEHISLRERVIYVRSAMKQIGDHSYVVGKPKTATSVRDVFFPDELRPILYGLWRRQGKPQGSSWVFPDPRDPSRPAHPERWRKAWRSALRAAGITGWTLRDLRTLHASLLIADGVDVVTVSKRLGHSEPGTTWRRYAAVITEADRDAAQGRMWDRWRRPGRVGEPDDPGGEAVATDGVRDRRDEGAGPRPQTVAAARRPRAARGQARPPTVGAGPRRAPGPQHARRG